MIWPTENVSQILIIFNLKKESINENIFFKKIEKDTYPNIKDKKSQLSFPIHKIIETH